MPLSESDHRGLVLFKSLHSRQKSSIGFLCLHGFSLRLSSSFTRIKPFLAPSYPGRLMMRPLSAISDRLLHFLDRNDLLSLGQGCSPPSSVLLLQLVLCCGIVSLPKSHLAVFLLQLAFSSSFYVLRLSHWRVPLIRFYCEWCRI